MNEEEKQKKAVLKALDSVECSKCGYDWVPRKDKPKACPRCKARLDW